MCDAYFLGLGICFFKTTLTRRKKMIIKQCISDKSYLLLALVVVLFISGCTPYSAYNDDEFYSQMYTAPPATLGGNLQLLPSNGGFF